MSDDSLVHLAHGINELSVSVHGTHKIKLEKKNSACSYCLC